jgi:hypothetical protein
MMAPASGCVCLQQARHPASHPPPPASVATSIATASLGLASLATSVDTSLIVPSDPPSIAVESLPPQRTTKTNGNKQSEYFMRIL